MEKGRTMHVPGTYEPHIVKIHCSLTGMFGTEHEKQLDEAERMPSELTKVKAQRPIG